MKLKLLLIGVCLLLGGCSTSVRGVLICPGMSIQIKDISLHSNDNWGSATDIHGRKIIFGSSCYVSRIEAYRKTRK